MQALDTAEYIDLYNDVMSNIYYYYQINYQSAFIYDNQYPIHQRYVPPNVTIVSIISLSDISCMEAAIERTLTN